ncbi:MAG: hypothetical protein A2X36_16765 [Elusimicrobia bacterium GWA2_69_24]|nr:MAG: hypothetical protein A2X36_16765 [Elusimicrobia bacterium GWA2_69_24]
MLARFPLELWTILTELAPYLFLGAAIATLLKHSLPADVILRQIGTPGLASVVKSVFLGVPMPLCSCGVIPTAIGLRKSGATNGAVVGFMISTPQTGADSLLITASFLGWPMALYMMAVTFVSGLAGGFLTHWFAPRARGAGQLPEAEPAACPRSEPPLPAWRRWYRYGVSELIGDVYRYLLVGILVSAALNLAVPPDYLAAFPALGGALGMLAVLVAAVPMYVCSNGSVPIAASLVRAGLPAGSALVFLMAGPATNVSTIGAVYRVLGRRVMLIYLGTIVVSSVLAGLLFQSAFGALTVRHVAEHHHAADSGLWLVVQTVSAAALAALLLRWTFLDLRDWLKGRLGAARAAGAQELALQVEGMTCANCAAHVRRGLEGVQGVLRVEVDVEKGLARLWGRALDREQACQAVLKAGYTVRG